MSPAPDPRRARSEPLLVERLRDEILHAPGRCITFARFMQVALTEPGLGYYATSRSRPSREGDFLTAPELHPFFGRCLGRWLSAAWEELGRPAPFAVREYGAGRGTLRESVLGGLAADGAGLAGVLEWQPVDLESRQDSDRSPFVGVILANEFLDALPVHRVVQRGAHLRERYVSWEDDWFSELEDAPSTAKLVAHLGADGVALVEGQAAEICLAAPAWLCQVASIERGHVLVIDYGYPAAELYGPRHLAGTLVTYRGHQAGDDPFDAVGHQDLTAHVDVSALERVAAEAGLEAALATTQAEFLVGLGLGEMLSDLGRDPATDPQDYLDARAAVARLLDPRHLGAFRVLGWARASA